MISLSQARVPVLTCDAAKALETALFAGDEAREWAAMRQAGAAVADAVVRDCGESGGFPPRGRVLVLAGKGHNGGDALIAARDLMARFPQATVHVVFAFGERALRPLAARAWRELQHDGRDRVVFRSWRDETVRAAEFDVCLDGIFGFQFRPPLDSRVAAMIDGINAMEIGLRAAVDLPSADRFRADFTYATGSVKSPVLASAAAGRVRYLDLGFFEHRAGAEMATNDVGNFVLTEQVLEPLRRLRPARSDKRDYGHVFLLGGSRGFPGAILMCAMAAVRSGAGLVTAFVPESLEATYAAQLPEAMWVGWPETPNGSLALEGEHRLRERIERADALVIGPGLGREPETLALVTSIVTASPVPLVLDADALQRDIVLAGKVPRVITPHAGEYQRIAGDTELPAFAREAPLTVVLKGPVTRVCDGGPVYHSLFGGPVLARGGSGDILAGLIGAQLAWRPDDPLAAAVRAVVWQGCAADHLARTHGAVAVRTTQLLDHLGPALRTPPAV